MSVTLIPQTNPVLLLSTIQTLMTCGAGITNLKSITMCNLDLDNDYRPIVYLVPAGQSLGNRYVIFHDLIGPGLTAIVEWNANLLNVNDTLQALSVGVDNAISLRWSAVRS